MAKKTSKDLYVTPESRVVQDNRLIEEKPAMTATELKLFLILVGSISYRDDELYDLDISVREVIDIMQADPKNAYSAIKRGLMGLSKKQFQVETEDESGKRTVEGSSYISSYKYQEGSSIVHISISKVFAPYLLSLKGDFTSYMLEHTLELKTSHAIRTYELLAAHRKLGKRRFTVEDYKQKLWIQDKYRGNNSNLKIRVLDPVCREISERTDLLVSYKMTGSGRSAIIEFVIIIKDNLSGSKGKIRKRILSGDIDLLVDLFNDQLKMGEVFSNEQVRKVAEYTLEILPNNTDVSEAYPKVNDAFQDFLLQSMGKQIDNPWGYFLSILESKLLDD